MGEFSTNKELGERGKEPEDKVRDFLSRLSEKYAVFDFQREYDARSAGGRLPARVGDFTLFFPGVHGALEVKGVEHAYRLPEKNFKLAAINRLRKRQLAGGLIIVLVYHEPTKLWRSPPLQFFLSNKHVPSWDLSPFDTFRSIGEALHGLTKLVEVRNDGHSA